MKDLYGEEIDEKKDIIILLGNLQRVRGCIKNNHAIPYPFEHYRKEGQKQISGFRLRNFAVPRAKFSKRVIARKDIKMEDNHLKDNYIKHNWLQFKEPCNTCAHRKMVQTPICQDCIYYGEAMAKSAVQPVVTKVGQSLGEGPENAESAYKVTCPGCSSTDISNICNNDWQCGICALTFECKNCKRIHDLL